MHVNCPNCGEKVSAENINIQQMTAVCAACDTVFTFALPEPKAKRRKVKQPIPLTLRDAETLHMEFRTNFRLDQNGDFLSSLFLGGMMGFFSLLILTKPEVPFILPLGFILVTLGILYRVALLVVNKTHIEMDEDVIRVSRHPLPNPLGQAVEVPLAGVEAIRCEETDISKKEAYDTPRYRVWAETADGGRRTIVNDVTEDYAVFIAQRLEERLHETADTDVSRLEARDDGETDTYPAAHPSQNHLNHR